MRIWGYWHRDWCLLDSPADKGDRLWAQLTNDPTACRENLLGGFTLHCLSGWLQIHLYCYFDYFSVEVVSKRGGTIWEYTT